MTLFETIGFHFYSILQLHWCRVTATAPTASRCTSQRQAPSSGPRWADRKQAASSSRKVWKFACSIILWIIMLFAVQQFCFSTQWWPFCVILNNFCLGESWPQNLTQCGSVFILRGANETSVWSSRHIGQKGLTQNCYPTQFCFTFALESWLFGLKKAATIFGSCEMMQVEQHFYQHVSH